MLEKIVTAPEQFEAWIRHHRRRREQEQENRLQAQREAEATMKRRLLHVRSTTPVEYLDLSADESPRPRQFSYVSDYWFEYEGETVRGLYLHGGPGTGKTAAAWEVWRRWTIENLRDETSFIKTVELAQLAKTQFVCKELNEEFRERFKAARDADLLVLDDLATERQSPSTESVLFELLDRRTEEHRHTVITCNLSPSDLSSKFSEANRGKLMRRFKQYFVAIDFDKG